MRTFKDLNLCEIPHEFKFFEENMNLAIELGEKCSRTEAKILSERLALQHFGLEKMHEKLILQRNGDLSEWRKKYQILFHQVLKQINNKLCQKYALKTIFAYYLNLHTENKELTKEAFFCYIGICVFSVIFFLFSGFSLQAFFLSFFCLFTIYQVFLMIEKFSLKNSSEKETQELEEYLALQHAKMTLLELRKVFQTKVLTQNKPVTSKMEMKKNSV